jgi:sulfhydrogenase subunit gamma (sulfur reductase)
MQTENIYMPKLMTITEATDETPDVRTFKLVFKDPEDLKKFSFEAGQFGLYSAFGAGESTFCIASSPTRKDYIECTFRLTGKVTTVLNDMNVGDIIGFRGPYGNTFPIEEKFKGKSITFIAGGIALPPVRSVIWNVLDLRDQFKDVNILYGARTYQDLVYKHELKQWKEMKDVNLITTLDPGGDKPEFGCTSWDGKIGFVPTVLKDSGIKGNGGIAVLCGPPIMIKLTLPVLLELGFTPENIYTTLENKMKCGLGKCGRCNVGNFYVCKHGPVITFADLAKLPEEY